MPLELFLLSTRIALLVLMASVLAFMIGWRLRASRAERVIEPATPAFLPLPDLEPEERTAPSSVQDPKMESLSVALASAEQQCLAALEQRDEAERLAHDRARELRRLTEELATLRAEHLALIQTPPTVVLATDPVASLPPPAPVSAPAVVAAEDLQPARALVDRLAIEVQEIEESLTGMAADHTRAQSEQERLAAASPTDKAALKAVTKESKDAARRLEQATESLERKRRQLRAVTRSLATAAEGLLVDDLTQIKGIKTVLNAKLHEHGIFSYQQIAQWDAEDMLAFGELLAFKNRIIKDGWQDQARALHVAAHPGLAELR